MKKMILIGALLLALVVGGFFIKVIPIGHGNHTPKDTRFEYMMSYIDSVWNSSSDWDDKLYKQNDNSIKGLSKDMPDDNIQALNGRNSVLAINKIDSCIFSEWNKADCKDKEIKRYMRGVSLIVNTDTSRAQDSKIIKIQKVDSVYRNILSFVNSPFTKTVEFDYQSCSWEDFGDFAQSKRDLRSTYSGNTLYKNHLSNITTLRNDLSEESVNEKLQKSAEVYYNTVYSYIVQRYDTARCNESDYENFSNRVVPQYENQYKSYVRTTENTPIDSYFSTYRRKLYQIQSNE